MNAKCNAEKGTIDNPILLGGCIEIIVFSQLLRRSSSTGVNTKTISRHQTETQAVFMILDISSDYLIISSSA